METLNRIKDNSLVSVCIAAYNDENTIGELIANAIKIMAELKLNFEIIIIDDCSQDKTAKILENLKSSYDFIRVVTHSKNRGYGATIKELLYISLGDFIFTLPGDFQIHPAEITKMLPWIKEYDIIIGFRSPRRDPFYRKINSILYNTTISLLFGLRTRDINSAKLIKRNVIDDIKIVSEEPFIDAELCAKAVKKGFKIKEVKIEHRQRIFGRPSGDRLEVMWKTFREVISMIGKI